jgi:hypothetical protein
VRPPDGSPADLALDLAIDGLLEEHPGPLPAETAELLATARFLRDRLPRYHPRFRFEEHLAARLLAAGRIVSAPAGHGPTPERAAPLGQVLETRHVAAPDPGDQGGSSGGTIVWLSSPRDGDASAAETTRRRRGLLAGGAIASGVSLAIPIAGAALVAWRRGRAGGSL